MTDEKKSRGKAAVKREELPAVEMPVLAVRGLVLFPGIMLQFDVGRKKSVLAADAALDGDRMIFLVAQKELAEENPGEKELFKVGVICRVKQVTHSSDENMKIQLQVDGIMRGRLLLLNSDGPYLTGSIQRIYETKYRSTSRTQALTRLLREKFENYTALSRRISQMIVLGALAEDDCGKLADYIAMNTAIRFESKQELLTEGHPVRRAEKLMNILDEEIAILKIENDINRKTQENINENQRQYYLREQLKVIENELDGEGGQEADEFYERVLAAKLPHECEEKLLKECDKISRLPYGSHELSVSDMYIDTCLSLPWHKSSRERYDLKKAEKILERDHYGLRKVKERFLEMLAVRKLSEKHSAQIVCLVGPPGVGKTSIARSVAEATGRKYVRVSLGGVSDEAEIMGHRRTYVGAMPGRIINAVRQAGTNNPLILLDEVDKLGQSFRGDPSSALLEVLDPEQNFAFCDHYIDMPFDLSRVLFITTANDAAQIPGPLYDRMDVIELSSYTLDEKMNIAMRHLIKKQLKEHGISSSQLKFTKEAVQELIDGYTREAGVRSLERSIATICRKTARRIAQEDGFVSFTVRPDNLEELLGPRKFLKDARDFPSAIGLVNGLAWTSVGGELLPIEAAVMPGTGKIQLTGSLGDVMKESAGAAITCIRTRAEKLGIPTDFYEKMDIHIHAPEGAVPKDGPSAGIAMATAVVSALCGIPVKRSIAMTGEITLQGRVLPIGGLKEKAMAACKNGISTVIIPIENVPDIAEIDEDVKKSLTFQPVKYVDTVLETALETVPEKGRTTAAVILPREAGKQTERTGICQ